MISFTNYRFYNSGNYEGTVLKPLSRISALNVVGRRIFYNSTIKYIRNFDGIVHFAAHHMPPFRTNDGVKVVGTIHDLFPIDIPLDYTLSFRWYIKRSLHKMLKLPNIIVTDEVNRGKLLDLEFPGKIFVVPDAYPRFIKPLETESIGSIVKRNGNKHYVLSVSTDLPHKNLKILPRVMELLGDGYKLVRVGPGAGDSITFAQASNDDTNRIYNSCDVMIYPSLIEGFGRPLIEAFAVGLPVAASDIPVFREIAGDAVEYFDPNSPEEAAQAVRKIMENREHYVRKSLERSKLYTPEAISEKIHKVYSEIDKS